MHPGAALPLLRDGDGDALLSHARGGHGSSRKCIRPGNILEAIEQERCTALYGVPTMFIAELSHPDFDSFDLSSLRTGVMAGAICPEPKL